MYAAALPNVWWNFRNHKSNQYLRNIHQISTKQSKSTILEQPLHL